MFRGILNAFDGDSLWAWLDGILNKPNSVNDCLEGRYISQSTSFQHASLLTRTSNPESLTMPHSDDQPASTHLTFHLPNCIASCTPRATIEPAYSLS